MQSLRLRAVLTLAALFAVTACGGGGDDGPSGNPGTIQVAVNPAALSVQQGGSGTVTVTLTRGGGFTGSADITVEGLPAGVTAAVQPNPITGTTTQAVVTVNASAAAVPGTSTVTIRASASGLGAATSTYQLTVTAAPGYTLTAAPNAVTAQQGATGTTNITIARTNFTGTVNLALQNAPAGITGTFNPAATTTGTSALTVNVAGSVTPGAYTLTVLGTATGLADRTTTIALTVAAAQTPAYTLALNPTALTLAQGASGVTTITTTKTGGFAAPVTLALEGAPAGVTGTFTPATAGESGGAGQALETATLTVNVGGAVPAGTYDLVVRGTATGLSDRTAALALTVNVASGYTLTLAQSPITVQAGATGNATVNVNRTGGFAGTVNLALDNPPAGFTGTFTPPAVTANASALAITVGAAVTAGSYNLTIRGTSTGQTDRTVVLAITVTVPASAIALTIAPTALSVQQGASGQVTATLVRTNFTGDVTLTATGAPANVTVTPNPATTTTNASTITVAVGAGVAANDYPIVIRANGTGVTEVTAPLTLTVTAATGGGSLVEAFCNADPLDVPIWFAVQDGNGAWTRVLPQVSGNETQFRFDVTSATGAIAYVLQSGTPGVYGFDTDALRRQRGTAFLRRTIADVTRTSRTAAARTAFEYATVIEYRTKAEFATTGGTACSTDSGTRSLNGSVTGVTAGQTVYIGASGSSTTIQGGVQSNFQLTNVQTTGAIDVIGVRNSLNLVTFTQAADRVIFRRNINPASGSTLPAFDFNAAEALPTQQRTLTVGNLLGDQWTAESLILTSRGAAAPLGTIISTGGNTGPWTGLPSSSLVANEFQSIAVIAQLQGTGTLDLRSAAMLSTDAVDRTIDLGERLASPNLVVAPTPYARPTASGSRPADYRGFLGLTYAQAAAGRSAEITATEAWLSAAGQVATYNLPFPDLSQVSGFQNDWGLKTGGQSTIIAVAMSSVTPTTIDGAIARLALRQLTQTWP